MGFHFFLLFQRKINIDNCIYFDQSDQNLCSITISEKDIEPLRVNASGFNLLNNLKASL